MHYPKTEYDTRDSSPNIVQYSQTERYKATFFLDLYFSAAKVFRTEQTVTDITTKIQYNSYTKMLQNVIVGIIVYSKYLQSVARGP